VPLGTQFVSLPLPSFTASGTAAIERGSAVNLLTSTSTSTDASNGYYVGATIAITGGTFSSNENSSSDDHLSVNGVTSGVIAGTNITASYNGATELLTLSGYDTIAHYNDLFKQIQYSATGNNPDNYGANPTRTITWTLLDGETNIPAGSQNSTTTTLSITAVNSAPTLGGAGNSVIYHFGDPAVIVDSALTVSDPDNQNLVGATVKISAGFLSGDTLSFSNQNGIAGSFSGDTLTLSGTATLAQYQTALVSVGYLSTASDPTAGGTDTSRTISWQVNDGSAANQLSNVATSIVTEPACYVEGTLIQTERGKTPVEELRRGDLVITTDGAFRPISWIGRRVVSAVFADPLRCWPIRVMAGALDINVPDRDLLVSPDHALLVDNVLINAGALVNGTSIVRETSVPATFVYYHVELDDHSLILAENTPAETFIDNVDRMGFDNWAEHEVLYPQGKAIDELPFPRAKARRQVPMHIRAALDARAEIVCGDKVIAVA
jgi:hypothetical protein